ncbi:MAG: tryptophan 7-halogenase, partial [Deltaproteobacteria bacterium]|nr:tryptophan 7-halogenase [Deltaproteobacteria bacterium]
RDNGGQPRPYTTATTMQSGWCWQIPMRGEDHLGYVHASRFIDVDAAKAELAARFPGARDFKVVRFQSGRRRDFIHGNVVAIGNSYAFVEPLESTAIHMIIIEVSRLLGLLAEGGGERAIATTSHEIGQHWDWLKSFLALHYRFNRRVDSPFWREVHLTTNWSAMEPIVADFQAHGAFSARAEPPRMAGDAVFGPRGIDIVMLGQRLVPDVLTPKTSAPEWHALMAMRDQVVAHALPHGEALRAVAAERRIWDDLVHKESSWVHQMTTDMQRAVPTRGRSQEALAAWAKANGVPVVLGRDAARLPDEFGASPNIDFGKYLRKVPEVVFRPRDQAQLAECLRHASQRRMPIRVRGAAHSSGGQTLADEGCVIDLRWLQRVLHDDAAQQRIRVEAGAWWLELCGHLQATGRRPAVLTDNWRSSVGGTLAVGGFGDASHRYGLQVGGVRELVLMTVDGTRHRVKPGDDLFDWSLAGRGQLGLITEVVLDTITRGTTLAARVIEWTSVERFLEDALTASREGRFDWLRARLEWTPGMIVAAAAGHLVPGPDAIPATAAADFEGLIGRYGPLETLDVFDKSVEATDSEWRHAAPCVEIVLPLNGESGPEETGRVIRRVADRIADSGLARFLPRGSSLMVLPAKDAQRLPLA